MQQMKSSMNFNISKTTIYTQVCCGYPSLGRLCRLGFRGSLHWNCYRWVFHIYASSVRCPFVFYCPLWIYLMLQDL